MVRALVSLLSEQVIAATLFCLTIGKNDDDLYVVTTEKMKNENKINDLTEVLRVSKLRLKVHEVLLETEEKLNTVAAKLETLPWDNYSQILVDITMGTKIMSLGVYSFFDTYHRKNPSQDIRLYYQPRGHNQLDDLYGNMSEDLAPITLDSYLLSYGIIPQQRQDTLVNDAPKTKNLFSAFLNGHQREIANASHLFQELRNARRPVIRHDKTICIDAEHLKNVILANREPWPITEENIKAMRHLCILADLDPATMRKKQIVYLSGGWFEELVYSLIREKLPELGDDRIALSLEIATRANVTNELDIALVDSHNSFIYIECKTSFDAGTDRGNILKDTIYKQSALRRKFGLNTRSVLATLDTITKDDQRAQAADYGIQILDLPILQNSERLNAELNKLMRIE